MRNVSGRLRHIIQRLCMLLTLIVDAVCYFGLCLRSNPKLAAEALFLRKQLALYEERQVKPRPATNATRIVLVWLSHFFDWRPVLRIVKTEWVTHYNAGRPHMSLGPGVPQPSVSLPVALQAHRH